MGVEIENVEIVLYCVLGFSVTVRKTVKVIVYSVLLHLLLSAQMFLLLCRFVYENAELILYAVVPCFDYELTYEPCSVYALERKDCVEVVFVKKVLCLCENSCSSFYNKNSFLKKFKCRHSRQHLFWYSLSFFALQ